MSNDSWDLDASLIDVSSAREERWEAACLWVGGGGGGVVQVCEWEGTMMLWEGEGQCWGCAGVGGGGWEGCCEDYGWGWGWMSGGSSISRSISSSRIVHRALHLYFFYATFFILMLCFGSLDKEGRLVGASVWGFRLVVLGWDGEGVWVVESFWERERGSFGFDFLSSHF